MSWKASLLILFVMQDAQLLLAAHHSSILLILFPFVQAALGQVQASFASYGHLKASSLILLQGDTTYIAYRHLLSHFFPVV